MLTPDNVFLVVKPVDMRRGIDTLTQYVQNELNAAWHDGAAFVFTNKVRSRIKVLRWDKHGVWLCTRRLHRGSFRWPRKGDATWHLTQDEFHWLVCRVDWQQVKGHDHGKMGIPRRTRRCSEQRNNSMKYNEYPCRTLYKCNSVIHVRKRPSRPAYAD